MGFPPYGIPMEMEGQAHLGPKLIPLVFKPLA